MFTGIITDVGSIRSVEGDIDRRFVLETAFDMLTVDIGASIACNGVCLTVVDKEQGWFAVDVSAESLKVTSLADWSVGTEVNLERSLKLGDEMGGHIVTGHVDCLGTITNFAEVGGSIDLRISVDAIHSHLIAPKGSVTVNGVSLTVNDVKDHADRAEIFINLIPHTQDVTNFRRSKVGDAVNIEFDILARYVARLQNRN
jgi:riboflavin synthase